MMTFAQFSAQHSALISQADDTGGIWNFTTVPEKLHDLLAALRPTFTYPEDVTVVDEGETFRVFYRIAAVEQRQVAHVTARVPREHPHLPTAVDLWAGYEWQEREAYDLFGIIFDGHPDLRRILTWEGFQGHPLRKDFVVDNDDSSWQIPEQTDCEIVELLQKS